MPASALMPASAGEPKRCAFVTPLYVIALIEAGARYLSKDPKNTFSFEPTRQTNGRGREAGGRYLSEGPKNTFPFEPARQKHTKVPAIYIRVSYS